MAISRAGGLYRNFRKARNRLVIVRKRLHGVAVTSYVHPSTTVAPDLLAEAYVFIGRRCTIGPGVKIGRYTMIASEVAIIGDDHNWSDPTKPMQFAGRPVQRRTNIGADVWIGRGATITRGVRIGDGAIIGAGSVVTSDVGAREVWAGVPARHLRPRFADPADDQVHMEMLRGPDLDPTFATQQAVPS